MLNDTRVYVADHEVETVRVLGPATQRKCDGFGKRWCREPAEWLVRTTFESDLVRQIPTPLDHQLCGTCLDRMHRRAKDSHPVVIVQRGTRPEPALCGFEVRDAEGCAGR